MELVLHLYAWKESYLMQHEQSTNSHFPKGGFLSLLKKYQWLTMYSPRVDPQVPHPETQVLRINVCNSLVIYRSQHFTVLLYIDFLIHSFCSTFLQCSLCLELRKVDVEDLSTAEDSHFHIWGSLISHEFLHYLPVTAKNQLLWSKLIATLSYEYGYKFRRQKTQSFSNTTAVSPDLEPMSESWDQLHRFEIPPVEHASCSIRNQVVSSTSVISPVGTPF